MPWVSWSLRRSIFRTGEYIGDGVMEDRPFMASWGTPPYLGLIFWA